MDPIADMLTALRNALMARHREVRVPYSRLKFEIARILLEEGYINNFRTVGGPAGPEPQPVRSADGEKSSEQKPKTARKQILIQLKYLENGKPVIYGLKRLSKPSRRVYVGADEIPRVLGGLGINILSTSRGIMTDREARKEGIGGELLLAVW